MSDVPTTLSTDELAARLGVTGRQLRGVTEGPGAAYARTFSPELIRRLQVAASLAHTIPGSGSRNTPFPAIARAVLYHPDEPEPRSWAILTLVQTPEEGRHVVVTYVHYRADLAGAVGDGAVVVKIDKLWPDIEAPA